MKEFGDIVKLKKGKSETMDSSASLSFDIYIIVDYADFSYKNKKGEIVEDIEFEIMKIHPVSLNAETSFVNHKNMDLIAKKGTTKHRMLLEVIKNERQLNGWIEEADYITALKQNNEFNISKNDLHTYDKDVVRYDLLKSVPECLYAIEALTWLNGFFGDEAYLQLREIVQKRLVSLIKILDTTDSCLDAMNVLSKLYETFNDTSYLELRKIIILKLEQMTSKVEVDENGR